MGELEGKYIPETVALLCMVSVKDLAGRTAKILPADVKERLRQRLSARYERNMHLLDYISTDDRVLDVGCVGHTIENDWYDSPPGLFLHKDLVHCAEHIVGIDIIESEVKKMEGRGYNVQVADAQDFDFKEEFDVIVAGELIEHLENPGLFLRCCHDHLATDGTLLITTPNPHNLKFSLWRLLGKSVNEEHTLWIDHDVMSTLAEREDFSLKDYKYVAPTITLISMPLYKLGVAKPVSAGGYIFILKKR